MKRNNGNIKKANKDGFVQVVLVLKIIIGPVFAFLCAGKKLKIFKYDHGLISSPKSGIYEFIIK